MTCTPELHQIVPILDPLGIALADQEDDGRGIGRAVVGIFRLPVRIDRLALADDGVDVIGERQGHHIGVEAVDHRPRLGAGAAVRHLDRHGVAGLLLPVFREERVIGLVELAGRVVGDIGQCHLPRLRRSDTQTKHRGQSYARSVQPVSRDHFSVLRFPFASVTVSTQLEAAVRWDTGRSGLHSPRHAKTRTAAAGGSPRFSCIC